MAEQRHTGISNRETPEEEQQERERNPQQADDGQTSHKTGTKPGAFGEERTDEPTPGNGQGLPLASEQNKEE